MVANQSAITAKARMRNLAIKGSRGRRWTASQRFQGWLATWLQDRRRARAAAGLPAAPAPPNAPTNLVLTDVASWIELTWQDTASNELGFRVYRKVDGGSFG